MLKQSDHIRTIDAAKEKEKSREHGPGHGAFIILTECKCTIGFVPVFKHDVIHLPVEQNRSFHVAAI